MPTITDWLMVIITAVYVIATVFICKANVKSAQATREQVAEARRQYEEEHRPYISYQIIFENRMFYGMRFTNYGRRVANRVKILLDQEFVDSITHSTFRKNLAELNDKEFSLGIGQSYDIFFGAREFRTNPEKKPIRGEITYSDFQDSYCENFEIDFEKYGHFFTTKSPSDNYHEDMKLLIAGLHNIAEQLEGIHNSQNA